MSAISFFLPLHVKTKCMLQAQYCSYRLDFRFEARTSRAVMHHKDTYLIRIYDSAAPEKTVGVGECPLFAGLGADDLPDYESRLAAACRNPESALVETYSSIRFGFESALGRVAYDPSWLAGGYGIATNGLIWMGDKATMALRIDEKLRQGFKVLKLKIGGINFDEEIELLASIRRRYSPETLEIRLDANGSFSPENAMNRLDRLSRFSIHSLEQPVKAGQTEAMRRICAGSPIAIGLDEELIGTRTYAEAENLVDFIRPQYLILKPSLCGGFSGSDAYIDIADRCGIGWWATSALESNIGLAAIAAWVAAKKTSLPQGLGTGMLYSNNIESPLEMCGERLWCKPEGVWQSVDILPWKN
jgi:L-alanine-DL-glutamate epimerase-like enolase superfamily enzyme